MQTGMTAMAGETTPLKSLDARYYTDPEIFAVESSGLLASSWQFADTPLNFRSLVITSL